MKMGSIMRIYGSSGCDKLIKQSRQREIFFKTNKSKSSIILEEVFSFHLVHLYRKYISLKPNSTSLRSFSIRYKNGRCTSQYVKINTISRYSQELRYFSNGRTLPGKVFGDSFGQCRSRVNT